MRFTQPMPAAHVIVATLVVCIALLTSIARADTLYHCETPDHRMVYTDSPAQLDQCMPVTFTQPHSTVNTNPGGTASPPEPAITSQIPASGSPAESPAAPSTTSETSQPVSAAPAAPPCQPGLNPLNPLSAPPCQQ